MEYRITFRKNLIKAAFTRELWNGSVWKHSALVLLGFLVYTMPWNRSVQNRSFLCIQAWTVPNEILSPFIRQEKTLKRFSHYTSVLRSLAQNFLRKQIFQLSSAIVSRISPSPLSKPA